MTVPNRPVRAPAGGEVTVISWLYLTARDTDMLTSIDKQSNYNLPAKPVRSSVRLLVLREGLL